MSNKKAQPRYTGSIDEHQKGKENKHKQQSTQHPNSPNLNPIPQQNPQERAWCHSRGASLKIRVVPGHLETLTTQVNLTQAAAELRVNRKKYSKESIITL